jgi:hypothetical protein
VGTGAAGGGSVALNQSFLGAVAGAKKGFDAASFEAGYIVQRLIP